MTGIVDEALKKNGEDSLSIGNYTKALLNFIENTATPMTLGIQGEWGSGKTSMLNQIWNGLDKRDSENDSVRYKQIWINAWEHSLLCSPEECLIKIVNEIISELVSADKQKTKAEKLAHGINKLARGAARIGGAVALGAAGKDIADDMFDHHENSIKQLRLELQNLTNEIKGLDTNPFNKFVIYVDDLDRIDPPDAVKILELLKNIFNIQDCIFLLAIDYQVVVKGLEEKFGKQTPENEWEFRAFFDKIIQLPFKMPMSNYNIGNYVLDLLQEIDFYSGEESLEEDLIRQFVDLSITGNPRSIKRLINSLSLIKIFNNISEDLETDFLKDKDGATIMFAMVCLQTAHPEVYDLLVQNPDFQTWDDELAYKITQGKEKLEENFEENFLLATKQGTDFDEDWEKVLFRICYLNPRARSKTTNISRFLSILVEEFASNKETANLTDLISRALGQTAITSITTKDNPNVRPPKGSYKPYFENSFESWLENSRTHSLDNTESFSEEIASKLTELVSFIKTKYKVVDFEQGKALGKHESDFVFKYSGELALYYKKKKILGFGKSWKKGKNTIYIRFPKLPKFNNSQLFFTKSNLHFDHRRKLYDFDENEKIIKGSSSYIDWLESHEISKDTSLEVLTFIIDNMTELLDDPNQQNKVITTKLANEMKEIFLNADNNSEEFKEAHKWLLSTFSDDYIKVDI